MPISERVFQWMTDFPKWLESFDTLNIPGWSVILVLGFASFGFVFAIREFLSWFLKTNSIIDEVVRLENLVADLQGDLAALEQTVERLRMSTGVEPTARIALEPTARTHSEPEAHPSAPAVTPAPRAPSFRFNQ